MCMSELFKIIVFMVGVLYWKLLSTDFKICYNNKWLFLNKASLLTWNFLKWSTRYIYLVDHFKKCVSFVCLFGCFLPLSIPNPVPCWMTCEYHLHSLSYPLAFGCVQSIQNLQRQLEKKRLRLGYLLQNPSCNHCCWLCSFTTVLTPVRWLFL